MSSSRRLVIVGGVAAGAAAAAKARRTSEDVEIVLFEAGPHISFANCGLPYYVGGEISDRKNLFVVTAGRLSERFNLDVRINTRVTEIDPAAQTVSARDRQGRTDRIEYDRLILATGANAVTPPIEGIDRPNIFTLRTVPDADTIVGCLERIIPRRSEADAAASSTESPPHALVIGGGYIGLETVEQLLRHGLKVTLVEMLEQLMPALDPEMTVPIGEALRDAECEIILGDAVRRIDDENGAAEAVTRSGRRIGFDVAILSVGVRPNVELAENAGIEIGPSGAIKVDARQRTSDRAIYAAGDNSEAMHLVLNRPVNIPLAGPANKSGRAAGANAALDLIGAGEDDPRRLEFKGVLGTAIVRVCDVVTGVTGINEKQARREGMDFAITYMLGPDHAGYYPGAQEMVLKLLYDPNDGRVLGAQAVGGRGVDKRLDVLSTAIIARMTVEDIEQLDLCYAPQFGSARDVIIQSGSASANVRRRQMRTVSPMEILAEMDGPNPPLIIDVRTPGEYERGHLEGADNIPVDEIRQRADEVPKDRAVVLYCRVGYRSYIASRILMNIGRDNVRNVLGGYVSIVRFRRAKEMQS